MSEHLDPLEANRPPRPPRPPAWCAVAGLAAFALGAFLAYVLFMALMVLAEPTRNSLLAMLAFFLLFAGTGFSSGLGIFVYHKLGRGVEESRLREQHGQVFGGDWRSGDDS